MTHIPWLTADVSDFPAPESALRDPNGLLAAGGDLSPTRLINAYRQGIFPWYSDDQPILWWSPDPRCILQPGDLHISRRLARTLRQQRLQVTFDQQFDAVMDNCRLQRFNNTWITDDMQEAYALLHALGHAHSAEVWQEGALVGGIYGVAIGACFFGESMYSAVPDASKIALVRLTGALWDAGFQLFDCQVTNPHLLSMGARDVPRQTFLAILRSNIDQKVYWPDHPTT